ncbi:hypothetical protein SB724_19215 [Bacillus sp. SIMBA_031]|uniref:hypothetical protein n=1 Tax=Bacillus sp. SIMBA_031 TaxID=3085774 RepID=UPI00397E7010
MDIDFSGVKMPFNGSDVLQSSMSFVGALGSLVLLGLAVFFAPRIFRVIRSAVGGSGGK